MKRKGRPAALLVLGPVLALLLLGAAPAASIILGRLLAVGAAVAVALLRGRSRARRFGFLSAAPARTAGADTPFRKTCSVPVAPCLSPVCMNAPDLLPLLSFSSAHTLWKTWSLHSRAPSVMPNGRSISLPACFQQQAHGSVLVPNTTDPGTSKHTFATTETEITLSVLAAASSLLRTCRAGWPIARARSARRAARAWTGRAPAHSPRAPSGATRSPHCGPEETSSHLPAGSTSRNKIT
jgi:hypothetical protein